MCLETARVIPSAHERAALFSTGSFRTGLSAGVGQELRMSVVMVVGGSFGTNLRTGFDWRVRFHCVRKLTPLFLVFGHQRSFYFVRSHASSFHAGLHGTTQGAHVSVCSK